MPSSLHHVIVFDFDGTLADTMAPLIDIYNTVLAPSWNCRPLRDEDREQLRSTPPRELMRMFGIPPLAVPLMVLRARRELERRMDTVRPVGGIPEAIRTLWSSGPTLGIATSNSGANVHLFLARYGLMNAFDFIRTGRKLFGKARLLRRITDELHSTPSELTYVGDEPRDIEAARAARVRAVGVAWGFAGARAMERAKPDLLLREPAELVSLVK